MARARKFLKRLLITLIVLAVIGGILFAVQFFTGLFDPFIAAFTADLTKIDQTLSRQMLTGLSVGTIALVLFILLFPLLMKGVKKKQYLVSIQRGLISAFVFMITEWFYGLMEKISRLYLFLAVAGAIVATILIVEFLSLAMPEEHEEAFRTDILAAIVSGLVFGILVKMIAVGWEILKLKLNLF